MFQTKDLGIQCVLLVLYCSSERIVPGMPVFSSTGCPDLVCWNWQEWIRMAWCPRTFFEAVLWRFSWNLFVLAINGPSWYVPNLDTTLAQDKPWQAWYQELILASNCPWVLSIHLIGYAALWSWISCSCSCWDVNSIWGNVCQYHDKGSEELIFTKGWPFWCRGNFFWDPISSCKSIWPNCIKYLVTLADSVSVAFCWFIWW